MGRDVVIGGMIDIKKFTETELAPTLRTRILRRLEDGEMYLGILLGRLKCSSQPGRDEALGELQKMQDEGLITAVEVERSGKRTLIIGLTDKS